MSASMKWCRLMEEQIIGRLYQTEAGMRVVDLCGQQCFSDLTFYEWWPKFGVMDVSLSHTSASAGGRKRPAEEVVRRTAAAQLHPQ